MTLRRLLPALFLIAFSFLLGACKNLPEPYGVPEQRAPIAVGRPRRVSRMVNMDDGDAESHIVRDIMGLSGNWRWTNKRPAVRVRVEDPKKLHLVVDFAVADATFKTTGPVKIVFYLNNSVIAESTFDMPGTRHIDMMLPPQAVAANTDAVLSAEIDKVWTSPTDGIQLGFILTRMGLVEK